MLREVESFSQGHTAVRRSENQRPEAIWISKLVLLVSPLVSLVWLFRQEGLPGLFGASPWVFLPAPLIFASCSA